MSEKNREIHILFEALAVASAPYVLYLSTKQEKKEEQYFLIALGLGSLLIDGYLLYDWFY